MDHKDRKCICPHKLQKLCKKVKIRDFDDVKDVVEGYAYLTDRTKRKAKKPSFKTKPFKFPHRIPCVPMTPDVYTRMKYIAHCDTEPVVESRCRQLNTGYTPSAPWKSIGGKSVRYEDKRPCDVILDQPGNVVKHTSKKYEELFKVASPTLSGEVINAQRAAVMNSDYKPPVPPTSAYDIYKPHSGIIVNQDKYHVPEVVAFPGPSRLPGIM